MCVCIHIVNTPTHSLTHSITSLSPSRCVCVCVCIRVRYVCVYTYCVCVCRYIYVCDMCVYIHFVSVCVFIVSRNYITIIHVAQRHVSRRNSSLSIASLSTLCMRRCINILCLPIIPRGRKQRHLGQPWRHWGQHHLPYLARTTSSGQKQVFYAGYLLHLLLLDWPTRRHYTYPSSETTTFQQPWNLQHSERHT